MLNYTSTHEALLASYLIELSDIGKSEHTETKASVFSDAVLHLHSAITEAQNIDGKDTQSIVDISRLFCEATENAYEQIMTLDCLDENISDKRELNVIKAVLNVMLETSRSTFHMAKAAASITQIKDAVKDAGRQSS